MEHMISSILIFKLINIIIHGRVKVEGKRDFRPIPEMVEEHEVVSAYAIKPDIESNIFDDGMEHKYPQRLDGDWEIMGTSLHQCIFLLLVLSKLHHCMPRDFLVSIKFLANNRDASNLGDNLFYNRELHPINFYHVLILVSNHTFGDRGDPSMEEFNIICNFPSL